jgi:hypothetical protein
MKTLLLIILFTIPVTALATDYFPLDQQYRWEYSILEIPDEIYIGHIIGEIDGFANYRNIGINAAGDTLAAFSLLLSRDAAGNVWGHGQSLPSMPIMDFDPPGIFIPALLYVGLTWVYDGELVGFGTLHVDFECLDEGFVTVPAGTFYCYRVVRIAYLNGDFMTEIHDWYSDGVGIVKQYLPGAGETYVLRPPGWVGVENTTWGGVKSLYR